VTNASTLVNRFAASLGWYGIERTDITLTPDICGNVPAGTVVTCWSTNDLKFFIQINQRTPGRFGAYHVSVVAERYNIAPMNFVPCSFETTDEADTEAQRLSALFARTNFRDKRWRRRYLEQHPRKLLRPKKKWRGWKGRLRTEPSVATERSTAG
jgi:hypothetical protein